MRKEATLLALAAAATFAQQGKHIIEMQIRNSAYNSLGTAPIYGPTRSSRVKNKVLRLRKQR